MKLSYLPPSVFAPHFPSCSSMGKCECEISKVHMADKFVEGDLENGERPCLVDELWQSDDKCCSIMRGTWAKVSYDNTFETKCGDSRGWTDHKVKTRRPLPQPAWSLTEHLKQHFPSWGDRKPHEIANWTEDMLPDGMRPLFNGEKKHSGDQCRDAYNSRDSWDTCNSGTACTGFIYRTKRPLPPLPSTPLEPPAWSKGWHNPANLKVAGEGFRFCVPEELDGRHRDCAEYWEPCNKEWKPAAIADINKSNNKENTYRVPISTPFPDPPLTVKAVEEEPWYPDKGDWYETSYNDGPWVDALQAGGGREAYKREAALNSYRPKFRPASPPDKGLDLTAWGLNVTSIECTPLRVGDGISDLSETLLDHCIKSEPEPTENNTMQTTAQASVPPSLIGTRWNLVVNDKRRNVTVFAEGPNGVAIQYRTLFGRRAETLSSFDWKNNPRGQIIAPVKFTGVYTKPRPGFIRRTLVSTAKLAAAITVGALFSTPIKYGLALTSGYLWALVTK